MNYEQYVLLNGEFIDTHAKEATMPIEERGFHFGDGVYEVARLYKGVYYTLEEHIDRLYRSLNEIKIKINWEKEEFMDLLNQLVKINSFTEDGIIYLQITRGSAARNHLFPEDTEPNVVVYVKKFDRPVEKLNSGVAVSIADDIRWLRCDIKSLNLLPNILAKQEAAEKGFFEVVLNRNGLITECSSSNFYMIKQGKVFTHPISNLILNGITRQRIKDLCVLNNIPFIEEAFTSDDIVNGEEFFLTSTTSEVMPVVQVNEKLINNGKVGSTTRRLQELFAQDANI